MNFIAAVACRLFSYCIDKGYRQHGLFAGTLAFRICYAGGYCYAVIHKLPAADGTLPALRKETTAAWDRARTPQDYQFQRQRGEIEVKIRGCQSFEAPKTEGRCQPKITTFFGRIEKLPAWHVARP